MKKNITINLCGRLFQIDEDAYELLQKYIESLRASFGKQAGGEEIADDIEERIAELFDELKANGTEAITIDHVKDIITRIGKPEQLAGEGEQQDDSKESHRYDSFRSAAEGIYDNVRARTAGKRLYRNPNDKMVAGVMSGIAAYTNTDPAIWRLLAVLFTFFYGIGLIAYIVLAIVLPQANSPEEKLQMEGKDVTPQNLASVVVDKQEEEIQRRPSLLRFLLSILLKIFFGFFVGIAAILCIALCIGFLFVLVVTVSALAFPISSSMPFSLESMGLSYLYEHNPYVLLLFCGSLFVMLLVPIYAIIHMMLSLSGKVKPMGMVQRIVWIVLWIVALCCLVPCSITMTEYNKRHFERAAQEALTTFQGALMEEFDSDYLKKHNWQLLKHENCNDSYVRRGEYFTGNRNKRYLDAWNEDCLQIYQAEKQQAVEPGQYSITCNARAAGDGVYIYATTRSASDKPSTMTQVPAYGNEGGEIWQSARIQLEQDSTMTDKNRQYLKTICEANFGKGYGWSQVEVLINVNKPDTLCYGISTDSDFTGHPNESEWFSACDFKVERIEKVKSKK